MHDFIIPLPLPATREPKGAFSLVCHNISGCYYPALICGRQALTAPFIGSCVLSAVAMGEIDYYGCQGALHFVHVKNIPRTVHCYDLILVYSVFSSPSDILSTISDILL